MSVNVQNGLQDLRVSRGKRVFVMRGSGEMRPRAGRDRSKIYRLTTVLPLPRRTAQETRHRE